MKNWTVRGWIRLKYRGTGSICRGLGGKIAVQYYTHWTGLEKCTWEHEVELEQYYGDVVLKYWSNQQEQVSGGNAKYTGYRVQAAKRLVAHKQNKRHVCGEGLQIVL